MADIAFSLFHKWKTKAQRSKQFARVMQSK